MLKSVLQISLRSIVFTIFLLHTWEVATLTAQLNINSSYHKISTYDGLSSDAVNSTFQDNKGYIYISTSNGLDRFDGKNIKSFRKDPQDKSSLIFNNVLSTILDSKGRLWVATRGGLCIKNEDDSFNHLSVGKHLSNGNVTALFEDSKDRIWVGQQNGLFLYNEANNNFKAFNYAEEDTTSLGLDSVESIFEDDKGNIWVSTWAGGISVLDERDPDQLQFKRLNLGTKHKIGGGVFPHLFQDEIGRVWTFKNDNLLVEIKFPIEKNILECDIDEIEFVNHPLEPELSDYQIFTLTYVKDNFLILSTNHGLKQIDVKAFKQPGDTDLTKYYKSFGSDLDYTRCFDIRKDDSGIVWLSTDNGLFKLLNNIEGSIAKVIKPFCKSKDLQVMTLGINKGDNQKWVGTNRGLYKFNKDFMDFEKIQLDHTSFNDVGISAYHQDYNGTIWAGTYTGKLCSIKNGEKAKEHHLVSLSNPSKRNIIWGILLIDDKLWLSTDQGLLVFDPSTKEYHELFAKNTTGLNGDNVFDVIQDSHKTIWVAYMGGGLTKVYFNEEGKLNFEQKSKGLYSNLILDMELVNDDIWLATVSGLQKYNISRDSFYSNTTLQAAISGAITSITSDELDNIWFSTNEGINHFNIKNQKLATFNAYDGTVTNPSLKCSTNDPSGKVYFGGQDGINVIEPQELIKNEELDKIILTNLTIDNESVSENKIDKYLDEPILNQNIEMTEEITLTQKHINIKFDFIIPDYLNPYMYEYSYKIDNLTPDWINLNHVNSIGVTKFNKGKYTLHIKARDSKGNQYKTKKLIINVLPYTWQTWWFRLTSFLAAIFLIIYFIRLNEKNNKIQKENLEAIVQERTNELENKNEKLQNYIQSNMQLEHFAHAAAHDLKSPMRTISSYTGMLKLKMKGKLEKNESDYINFIESSSKRLIDLVDDMLAFSKINSEKLSIAHYDPKTMVDNVLNQLETNIQEKDAKITIANTTDNVRCDEIKVSRVLQNLIANALKFVPENIKPNIKISIREIGDDIQFSIKDNGIGISKESQDEIFGVFKRIAHDSNYDGTGMGLAICKNIVERHGGRIWIESDTNKGSTFHFTIPKEPHSLYFSYN